MTEPFRPTLLLSMPQLQDPNFARTVVLLCDYVPEGAFGLVLNRPTDMTAASMVRLDPPVAGGNDMPLCVGGPVGSRKPHRNVLGDSCRSRRQAQDAGRQHDGLWPVMGNEKHRRRLAVPQLDQELAQSAWLMGDVERDLVFDVEPSLMWETAIRRLGADPSALQTSHGVH